MTFQPKTRVYILAFVGADFDPRWNEMGTVCKPRRSETPPDGWSIVQFDNAGKLCVHSSRLKAA